MKDTMRNADKQEIQNLKRALDSSMEMERKRGLENYGLQKENAALQDRLTERDAQIMELRKTLKLAIEQIAQI